MGIPVTSVIARSSINVRSNATTRLPALVQSGFVVCSVVFITSTIATIPMPALSGVLNTTWLGMLNLSDPFCSIFYSYLRFQIQKVGGMVSLGLAERIGIDWMTGTCSVYDDMCYQWIIVVVLWLYYDSVFWLCVCVSISKDMYIGGFGPLSWQCWVVLIIV